MKRISLGSYSQPVITIWQRLLPEGVPDEKKTVLDIIQQKLVTSDQKIFYPLTVNVLRLLGFDATVGNQGDTSNRVDAFIRDSANSIPIEIKSPTEILNINIKAIQQAVENKVILLSRQFYPTTFETTSLAIGYRYPEERSDVHELIEDVKHTYGFNIGFITIYDLLSCLWDQDFSYHPFDKSRIIYLKGKFQ